MTAPLDEKGLEAALTQAEKQAQRHGDNTTCSSLNIGYDGVRLILAAARAYLAASPSPSEKEVVADRATTCKPGLQVQTVAWLGTNLDGESEPFLAQHQAEFWSNGASNIEPLVTLSSAQSALSAMAAERDEAKGKLALIVDRIVYADSYGVPGSDFQCCHLCNGGGAPGIPFEHDEQCPVRQVERDYEQWFDDIQATEDALLETEERAEAAEAQVLRLTEENEALRAGHKFMADFVRPRIPEGQNLEQAESFLAWIGMIVRLEERGDKAVARSEAAEARIKALEEALRPFAEYAWSLRGFPESQIELGWLGQNEAGEPAEVNLRVSTFQAARSALKENAL